MCSDRRGAIISGALPTMLVFQAFLNIECVIGILPTTGKPLPFISYGGSSLLSTLLIVGIVLAIARQGRQRGMLEQQRRRENIRVSVRTGRTRGSDGSASRRMRVRR